MTLDPADARYYEPTPHARWVAETRPLVAASLAKIYAEIEWLREHGACDAEFAAFMRDCVGDFVRGELLP